MNRRGKTGNGHDLHHHGAADTTSFRMPKGHSPKVVAHHSSSGSKNIVGSTSQGGVSQKFGINGFQANGKLHHGGNNSTTSQ